jgi:Uma2 family endonuclease
MSTALEKRKPRTAADVPLLQNGDRLTQPEFHRRYESYPEDICFELVGGTVYVSSPLSIPHSDHDDELGFLFSLYRRATPGVKALHGTTIILGAESEPQPDLGLMILSEFGGRCRISKRKYVQGAPELLAEIAFSSVALDLHQKKTDYEKAGVDEYLVICIAEAKLVWFDFKNGRCIEQDALGIYRSRVFPGLWIDSKALLALDSKGVETMIRKGLSSQEHADFVKKLQAAKRRRSPKNGRHSQ